MDSLSSDQLKEIECPVCLELMVPPIFQCKNGHSTCWTCRSNIAECPVCRGELSEVRNLHAEDLSKSVYHYCKFKASGCSGKYLLTEKKQHESFCLYRNRKCPLSFFILCTAEVDPSDARKHIEENHTVAVISKDNAESTSHTELSSYRNIFIHINKRPVIVEGEMFIPYEKKVNESRHICYAYVGSVEDARKYKYKITSNSFINNDSITVCCQCRSYLEVKEFGIEGILHAIIPEGYRRECLIGDGYYFQVEILKVLNPCSNSVCQSKLDK